MRLQRSFVSRNLSVKASTVELMPNLLDLRLELVVLTQDFVR